MNPKQTKDTSLPSQERVDNRRCRRGHSNRLFKESKNASAPRRRACREPQADVQSECPVDIFFTLEYLRTETIHRAILITMYFDESMRDAYVWSIKNRNESIITIIDEGDAEKLMSGKFGLVPDVFEMPTKVTINGEEVGIEEVSSVIPKWVHVYLSRFYEAVIEENPSELFYYFTRK